MSKSNYWKQAQRESSRRFKRGATIALTVVLFAAAAFVAFLFLAIDSAEKSQTRWDRQTSNIEAGEPAGLPSPRPSRTD